MLDAGIDVFSTVNVQHLESLNDQVAELTGVRVRETFPDRLLGEADEVVLVDLTPEALIDAPARGQGLPAGAGPDGAQELLPHREPAGAARGGAAAGGRGGRGEAARPRARSAPREERLLDVAPQAVGERLLALVEARAELAAGRAAGLAFGAAARADLDILVVRDARARSRRRRSAASSRRCGGSPRCSART